MSITDLFFRPFDKARLERLVLAIDQDKLSAALVCDSEGLLDHYGRMLVKKLRLIPGLTVEVYYPNSTEALLNRFNRILEDVPIDSAVKPEISEAPDKVLVAFDSQATGIREVQLMARLVRDFPGANTRIILMLDKLSSTQYEKKIEAFGNKIIRWDIATPTDREAAVLLSESELSGMQPEVRQALANVGVSLDAKLALAASSKALKRAEETLSPATHENLNKEEKANNENDSKTGKNVVFSPENNESKEISARKNFSKDIPKEQKTNHTEKFNALVATFFLIFVSSGVVAWVTLTEAFSFEKILNEARNVLLTTNEVKKLKNTQENRKTDQNFSNVIDGDKVLITENSKKVNSDIEDPLFIRNTNTEKPSKPLQNANSTDNSFQPSNPTKEIDIKTNQTIPERTQTSGSNEKFTPELQPGFYVQHTARPTKELAQELKNKFPSLSNSLILKLSKTRSDGHFFVLLTGPFTTLDEAKSFTIRDDIPQGTWIRGALGIRPLIMPID